MAATWDRERRVAKLFINGTENARKGTFTGLTNYEVMDNSHSFYQMGIKKDDGQTFRGLVRDLKVFKRVLNGTEMSVVETCGHGIFIDCLVASAYRAVQLIECRAICVLSVLL